jgi:SAM-dependent methyltransferase
MLDNAAALGRASSGALILADVMRLPLADSSVDAVFAAGLLPHLDDSVGGLRELARVCRPGGRLVLFHPIGRAALARRHGHELNPDDIRAEPHIRAALASAGWRCERYEDGDARYLVLASRVRATTS